MRFPWYSPHRTRYRIQPVRWPPLLIHSFTSAQAFTVASSGSGTGSWRAAGETPAAMPASAIRAESLFMFRLLPLQGPDPLLASWNHPNLHVFFGAIWKGLEFSL